jgi:hypothetical protein
LESRYTHMDVDLLLLGEWIERFFKKESFNTIKGEEAEGYKITARPTPETGIWNNVTVSVSGGPDDFEVKFVTGARSSIFVRLGQLAALFGGGILTMRGLKSQEAEEKLEKVFWIYVNEKIDRLARSHKWIEE